MLHIPEALRHTMTPGLQPGCTREDIKHLPRFIICVSKIRIDVTYPRSNQAYNDARTSTWMYQRGYITIADTFITLSQK